MTWKNINFDTITKNIQTSHVTKHKAKVYEANNNNENIFEKRKTY